MTNMFGATSTTKDVLAGVHLRGKRIRVTGVSAGIGVETVTRRAWRSGSGCGSRFGKGGSCDGPGSKGSCGQGWKL
jgi:hypothetical protein